MNRTVLASTAILAVVGLLAYLLYLQNSRYSTTGTEKGYAYVVDRKTGESWLLAGEQKVAHEQTKPTQGIVDLPSSELQKITGNGGFGHGSFDGKLYNGSDWTISEIVVCITANEKRAAQQKEVQKPNRSGGSMTGTAADLLLALEEPVAEGSELVSRWKRNFRKTVRIEPQTTERFTIDVTGEEGTTASWAIVGARGEPPR